MTGKTSVHHYFSNSDKIAYTFFVFYDVEDHTNMTKKKNDDWVHWLLNVHQAGFYCFRTEQHPSDVFICDKEMTFVW